MTEQVVRYLQDYLTLIEKGAEGLLFRDEVQEHLDDLNKRARDAGMAEEFIRDTIVGISHMKTASWYHSNC